MLNDKGMLILKKLSVEIEKIISKADKENETWINSSELPDNLKKSTKAIVNEFEKEIEAFFSQQKKAYLLAIDNADFSNKPIKKANELSIVDLTQIISQFVLANNEHYVDVLSGIYEAFAVKAVSSAAQIIGNSIKNTKASPEISLTSRAVKWIDKTKIPFSREVQQSTHDSIIKIISDSLSTHSGSQNIVNTMYSYYTEGKFDEFKKGLKQSIRNSDTFDWSRARTVARTETMSVTNAGILEGYRQSKVIKYKKWKCEGGARSRDTHIAADSIVVPIDEPFVVGGYQLMHPGDRSMGAPGRETINCRCCMSAVPEAVSGKYNPQYNPYKEKDAGTDEWLSRQSVEFQSGYLGSREKQKLFAEGVIGAGAKDKSLKELSESEYIVRRDKINTKSYTDKFKGVGKNNVVDTKVRDVSVDILNHRNATPYEDAYYLSARTGKTLHKIDDVDFEFGVPGKKDSKSFLLGCDEDLIAIHNHPSSSRPSITDIATMLKYPNIKKLVVVGHDSAVYIISDIDERLTAAALDKLYVEQYNYYKRLYPPETAKSKAVDLIYSLDLFKFIKR